MLQSGAALNVSQLSISSDLSAFMHLVATYFLTPAAQTCAMCFTCYQLGCHSRRSSRHCCQDPDCQPHCCCCPQRCCDHALPELGAGALALRGALAALRTAPSSRSCLA